MSDRMRASFPYIVRGRADRFSVSLAVYPPFVTVNDRGDEIREYLSNVIKGIMEGKLLEETCRDPEICLPAIHGGMFFFLAGRPVYRWSGDAVIRRVLGEAKMCRPWQEFTKCMIRAKEGGISIEISKNLRGRQEGIYYLDNIGMRFTID